MMRATWRRAAAACVVGVLVTAAVVDLGSTPQTASAADPAAFQPGQLISDALFFDGASMTAGDVQAFLQSKRPTCATGAACLKDYVTATTSQPVEAGLCNGYQGAAAESAATIIAKVGTSCGISPKALLVILQKEQGLVTSSSPSAAAYNTAMGFGCPDSSVCDTQYYGFFNQVYRAARQFKRYAAYPTSYSYRAGRLNTILFNPNVACGSSQVYIENQATAGLYIYTPYQPNAAALASLYGTGDSCSAYGNRNFWRYYTDWFGSTQIGANLVRTTADPTVYLVTADQKYQVDSPVTLDSLGVLGQIGYVQQSFLDAHTTGPTLGRFIRDRAGFVYLFDRGYLFQVKDCAQLSDWGASCADYGSMALTDTQMAPFYKAGMLSNLVGTPEGKQFYVYGGAKHEVADVQSLALAPVAPALPAIGLHDAAMSSLPYGAPLVRSGMLVRDRATGASVISDDAGVLTVPDGFVALSSVSRLLPVVGLDGGSIAAMGTPVGSVTGVFRAPDGSASVLTTAGAVVVSTSLFGPAYASAPVISATLLHALAPSTTGGPVFVRSVSSPSLFLASGGSKRPVMTMAAAYSVAGGQPLMIALVAQSVLDAMPTGGEVLAAGRLVKKVGSPEIYLVDGTASLVFLPSFDVATAVGLGGFSELPVGSFAGYAVASGQLSTAWACGAQRYVGMGGQLVRIAAGVVEASGLPVTTLDPVTCMDVPQSSSTAGGPVFVRSVSSPSLFLASGGSKRPVMTMAAAYSVAGGQPLMIALVAQSVLDAMPTGSVVS